MIMYQEQRFQVTNGILRGLRVVDMRTGNILKPSPTIAQHVLTTWRELQRYRFTSKTAKRCGEYVLFADFGSWMINPSAGDPKFLFLPLHERVERYGQLGNEAAAGL
ncbi:hypothetical protein [Oceaniglobus trochenteri]|uniref:hypothetical protein n=1 Tax=Oceaniglobus trochenteri TaxID=2763260 RepID=UPI001CFFE35A|nr:hypothetical protein [Oceaniglobus trochenteri]